MIGLFSFDGGLKLPAKKTLNDDITVLDIPPQLVIPTLQHKGHAPQPLVNIGDDVLTGQLIAADEVDESDLPSLQVHASSSGRVIAIEPRPIPHIDGLQATCIIIDTDSKDTRMPPEPALALSTATPAMLQNRIAEAGIAGLGGAGFPTWAKLRNAQINTLIINGAECEPYISCDTQLMLSRATEIIEGTVILIQALGGVDACVIALEDDQPSAFAAMTTALENYPEDIPVRLTQVPAIYPVGGERQLIQVLTGQEIPSKFIPTQHNILVHNIGTVVAIGNAVMRSEPMISRIVTVTGNGVKTPKNLEVRLGTPLKFLLEACERLSINSSELLIGGPMMGFPVADDALPVTKTVNCLLTSLETPAAPEVMPCIRCGDCEQVCPARLLPQQLYQHTKLKDLNNAEKYNLFDCIECGCCEYVCPSRIPLVDYYRQAKVEIRAVEANRAQAEIARQRYEYRLERLENEEQQAIERQAEKREALKQGDKIDKQALIKAAMERAKAKKNK